MNKENKVLTISLLIFLVLTIVGFLLHVFLKESDYQEFAVDITIGLASSGLVSAAIGLISSIDSAYQAKRKVTVNSLLLFRLLSDFMAQAREDLSKKDLWFNDDYYATVHLESMRLLARMSSVASQPFPQRQKNHDLHQYLESADELCSYLFDLDHEFRQLIAKHDRDRYDTLQRHMHDALPSLSSFVQKSLVFISDYLDHLLLEVKPFLLKPERERYLELVKGFQTAKEG